MRQSKFNILILLIFSSLVLGSAENLVAYQDRIRAAGSDMLENLEVSYVYGGSRIGDPNTCSECNTCLEKKSPAPKQRFKECPNCRHCSLDCSHFVQLVFARAGLGFPYITSTQMLELSAEALARKYNLNVIDPRLENIIAGDLLVYRGHVVIVERTHEDGVADVIHATGGKDIREPGQGIQRERFARVSNFRGGLLRVIRHSSLNQMLLDGHFDGNKSERVKRHAKLRPVEKRIRD